MYVLFVGEAKDINGNEPFVDFLAKELLHAISQFVVMFTAQVWYFRMKGRDASFWSQFSGYDMLYGYLYAITYHLGSLLYGSFLCTLFRVARMLAAMLVRASEDTGHEGSKSKLFFCVFVVSTVITHELLCFTSQLDFADPLVHKHGQTQSLICCPTKMKRSCLDQLGRAQKYTGKHTRMMNKYGEI